MKNKLTKILPYMVFIIVVLIVINSANTYMGPGKKPFLGFLKK